MFYPSVFPPIHNSPYHSHEYTEPYMFVCLSCHIRDRSFCHNAHWQTNYKHEMHTCIQQNMQNGGWKQWRGTTHIFIFECGLDVKVSYSHVHLTNVNLCKTKELQFHFSTWSISDIIPVPDYMLTASNESVAGEQWTEIDLEGNNHGIIGKCTGNFLEVLRIPSRTAVQAICPDLDPNRTFLRYKW